MGMTQLAGSVSAATKGATWSYSTRGAIGPVSHCTLGRIATHRATCTRLIPNAPRSLTAEHIVVSASNPSSRAICLGISVSSAAAAGLEVLCIRAQKTNSLTLQGRRKDYERLSLTFVFTSGFASTPISPIAAPTTVTFLINVTAH